MLLWNVKNASTKPINSYRRAPLSSRYWRGAGGEGEAGAMPPPIATSRKAQKIAYAKKLRQRMTNAEIKLWAVLRNRQFAGIKFKRQVPFGPYIVDFYCPEHRLIVEVDGAVHATQREYDRARTKYLAGLGYRVIRITNEMVYSSMAKALNCILDEVLQF